MSLDLKTLEQKYYLCQPLKKEEWKLLATEWLHQLVDAKNALKQKDVEILTLCKKCIGKIFAQFSLQLSETGKK